MRIISSPTGHGESDKTQISLQLVGAKPPTKSGLAFLGNSSFGVQPCAVRCYLINREHEVVYDVSFST